MTFAVSGAEKSGSGRLARGLAPVAALALLSCIFVLATMPTAADMVRQWLTSSSYRHGLFVIPAAVWMIAAHAPQPAPSRPGAITAAILTLSALAWLAGRAASASLVEQGALVGLLVGAVGAVYGASALKAWAWPLLFLFFMVPAGESVIPALQRLTIAIAAPPLHLIGVATEIDGVLIRTEAGSFLIASACAGLRILLSVLMIAAIFAYVAFASWKKRLAFLGFAAALALLANALRAFAVIALPNLAGKPASFGADHQAIGAALYLVVFIVLFLTGRAVMDPPRRKTAGTDTGPLHFPTIGAAALLAVVVAAYGASVVDRPLHRTPPASLALLNAQGWRILPPPDIWRPAFPGADRTAAATYMQERAPLFVAFGAFTHDRRGAETFSSLAPAWPAAWRETGRYRRRVAGLGDGAALDFTRFEGPDNRRMLVLTVFWLDDRLYTARGPAKLAQMGRKLRGDNPPGGVITIGALYNRDAHEAAARIGAFVNDLEDLDAWRNQFAVR